MRRLVIAFVISLAGCVSPATFYPCSSSTDCTVDGVCEPEGFCSFTDATCDSGRRFGEASGNSLANTCVPQTIVCGDGMVQGDEECEDGNQVASDDCVSCKFSRCGDGAIRAGIEDCDDGNTVDGDACNSLCVSCAGDASGVFEGHCYMRINAPLAWSAASLDCVARGGALVSINSAAENTYVMSLLASGVNWIGLDDDEEGQFYWQDDLRPTTYTNWAATEPNGGTAENCGAQTSGVGTWSTGICTVAQPYVCERTPWTIDPLTRHAYHYVGGVAERDYPQSVAGCVAAGAHLATVTTAAENMVIDAITGATTTNLGGNDIATEGTYVWEGSEAFAFTAWGTACTGNPAMAPCPSGVAVAAEDCIVLLADGTWNDGLCTRASGYLCEIEP